MNLQQLRFVIALDETRSFTRAADQCCVTQPALSNAISQLEEELGGRLFERAPGAVFLTAFGEHLIGDIRRIGDVRSALLQKASDYLSQEDTKLKVGMSPLLDASYLKQFMLRLSAANPSVEVLVSEMNLSDITPAVEHGLIDIGFGPETRHQTSCVSQTIYEEPLLCVSIDRAVALSNGVDVEKLRSRKVLLVTDDCGLAITVQTLFEERGLTMNAYEGRALSYQVLEQWAHLGIGDAVLPASKVTATENAKPILDSAANPISLSFSAFWQKARQSRLSLNTALSVLPSDPKHKSACDDHDEFLN